MCDDGKVVARRILGRQAFDQGFGARSVALLAGGENERVMTLLKSA